MTQAQYAAFLKVGLRTLIKAEQDAREAPPWSGSAMGFALVRVEFESMNDMQARYREFREAE